MIPVGKIPLIALLIVSVVTGYSQKRDSSFNGSVQGIVFDSAHNHILRNATIAIYSRDSDLVNFGLSNTLGEFHIEKLPFETQLKLIISYIGYKNLCKNFILPKGRKVLDLNGLSMTIGENLLTEVVVTSPPPVKMNGDTLEFNTDAFHLDKNAVVEDLFRKLPGVIIWGDGTITVNGKKVSNVLVDGQSFFGGDPRIAIQNLPKKAVEKVQVYKQKTDKMNPFDSTLSINLKLKEGMKIGSFGKVGAGYGSRKTYESDANINFYSPNTQFGLIGAKNNVNKIANSVSQMMQNSTFKGVGASSSYQPDFSMAGLNKTLSTGFTIQHKFVREKNGESFNKINADDIGADYFFKKNNNVTINNSNTLTTLGKDSTVTQNSSTNNQNNTINNIFNVHQFELKKGENYSFELTPSFSTSTSNNLSNNQTSSSSGTQGLQSTSNSESSGHGKGNVFLLNTEFSGRVGTLSSLGISAGYTLNDHHNNNNSYNISNFISYTSPSSNQNVQREYKTITNDRSHHFSSSIDNFSHLLFGYGNFMSAIGIRVSNSLNYSTDDQSSIVRDKDTVTGAYLNNPYLTNNSKYLVIDENPTISFSRLFERSLADRYRKSLNINMDITVQFYRQKNRSSHNFQDFARNYQNLTPNISFRYDNEQFGRFKNSISLGFSRSFNYPTVDLLYPIIDSSNFYYLQEGNPNLKPSRHNEVNLEFKHANSKKIEYTINLTGNFTDNYFANSTFINESGTTINQTINLNGNGSLNLTADIQKAFTLSKNNQLQLMYKPQLNISRTPGYMQNQRRNENILNISHNTSITNNLSVYYSFKDQLAVDLSQNLSYYHSRQQQGMENASVSVSNASINSVVSVSFNCNRRLNVSSNVTYNNYSSAALLSVIKSAEFLAIRSAEKMATTSTQKMATRLQDCGIKNRRVNLVFKNCFPIFHPVTFTREINHFTLEQ